jgi:hypothetical protein
VVKSGQTGELAPDLPDVFEKLRIFQVCLNPEKCVFRVPRGMLLGFIMSERDIEANPKNITTITSMGLIQNIKGSNE